MKTKIVGKIKFWKVSLVGHGSIFVHMGDKVKGGWSHGAVKVTATIEAEDGQTYRGGIGHVCGANLGFWPRPRTPREKSQGLNGIAEHIPDWKAMNGKEIAIEATLTDFIDKHGNKYFERAKAIS